MEPKINYRAKRAERVRKKAAKKQARLARNSDKQSDPVSLQTVQEKPLDGTGSLPSVHRFSD